MVLRPETISCAYGKRTVRHFIQHSRTTTSYGRREPQIGRRNQQESRRVKFIVVIDSTLACWRESSAGAVTPRCSRRSWTNGVLGSRLCGRAWHIRPRRYGTPLGRAWRQAGDRIPAGDHLLTAGWCDGPNDRCSRICSLAGAERLKQEGIRPGAHVRWMFEVPTFAPATPFCYTRPRPSSGRVEEVLDGARNRPLSSIPLGSTNWPSTEPPNRARFRSAQDGRSP